MPRRILLLIALAVTILGRVGLAMGQTSPPRKRILNCPTASIDEFQRVADLARELGFTHVAVSDLPKPRWMMKFDPTDPYPQWNLRHASIFATAVPAAMREWLDADFGQRCIQILKQRGAILRERGLKAAFFAGDPLWLPDAAYEAHPNWRGPRCEHPKRAKRAYYAPCIDDPEILAMYRASVAEICRAAPVELFEFKPNDAGAGICWDEALYDRVNGPEACKSRGYAQRVVGFLTTIQDGAKDAGIAAPQVEINIRTTPNESESARSSLREGQFLAGRDGAGRTTRVAAGFSTYLGRGTGKTATGPGPNVICAMFGSYAYASHTAPVIDVPQPFPYAEQLARFAGADSDQLVYIPSVRCEELFDLVRTYRDRPFAGAKDRRRAVAAVAARRVGAAAAPLLVDAWEHIGKAVDESFSQIQYGGPLFTLGTVNQRWLIRPLVPFPLELKPDEKDYYRKHQFQAVSEQDAADLMNCQGVYLIRGTEQTASSVKLLESAIRELQAARDVLHRAALRARDDTARQEITTLDLRLAALICVTRNAIETAKYQAFLDRSGPTTQSAQPIAERENGIPVDASTIIQADINNTNQLIELLKLTGVPLIYMARDADDEDVFTFGPALVQQLEKKIQIERKHLPDHRRF